MSFAIAASYWATYPISTCLRPRSAPALGDARPLGLDPVPAHEPIHEIEQAANRDGGMQGLLVPSRRKDRVGIGLHHAWRRQRQLLHESEKRPQLAVDGSGREIL